MALIHTLTYNGSSVVIDEPIGFDNFKVSFKRHEYHGITAEVSEQDLEFYGAAIAIIKRAYEADIDSEVDYSVADGDTTIYTGRLDLSTYNEQWSEYHSVSCRVGEIGAKTTFNNRVSTDIDMNSSKTIDCLEIGGANWEKMEIPAKQLIYTNVIKENRGLTVKSQQGTIVNQVSVSGWQNLIKIYLHQNPTNEFGNISVNADDEEPAYSVGDEEALAEFRDKFGMGCKAQVDFRINATFNFTCTFRSGITSSNIGIGFGVGTGDAPSKLTRATIDNARGTSLIGVFESSVIRSAELPFTPSIYFDVNWNEISSLSYTLSIERDSVITMKMADTVQYFHFDVDMVNVNNALKHVIDIIGERRLNLKTDWYHADNATNDYGGGALKYLTNGYKIRGVYGENRAMTISFGDLIDSLSAMDCIGWGFATEEGSDVIRVERWDWFFKGATILTLPLVKDVRKTIDTNMLVTGANFGFKKYDTDSDFYSIDSIHGERSYETGIKALSNTKSIQCDFIADNYAIEETRRAAITEDRDESFKYDENIFVFEAGSHWNQEVPGSYRLIETTATNIEGVARAGELINAGISPVQCAARWQDYIFSSTSRLPMKFTTGKLNCNASFTMKQSAGTDVYLQSFKVNSNERADIEYRHAKFKAENWEFECPITLTQYQLIKANPYGLIHVNDVYGWIKEFSYSFADGMATFKLIAKY